MGTESIPKNILNKSDGSNSFVSVIGAGFYFKRRFIGDTYWYSVVKLPCVSVGSMSTDSFFLFGLHSVKPFPHSAWSVFSLHAGFCDRR